MAMHARELVNQKGILVVPAVYDALTAKIAERVGFKAVGLGGFLVAASRLGLPDVGYLTMSEMVEACRAMAGAVGIPVLADGDTGYGNPLNVRRTVQEYEAAGVAGLHIEEIDAYYPVHGQPLVIRRDRDMPYVAEDPSEVALPCERLPVQHDDLAG